MQMTVTLPDDLLLEAKRVAADRRMSLKQLLEASLAWYLANPGSDPDQADSPTSRVSRLPVWSGSRLVADVDLSDTSALLDLE